MQYEDSIVLKLGKMLNADPQDFAIALSLTSGLHSVLSTFYKPAQTKKTMMIVLESEFTSDIFACESWVDLYAPSPSHPDYKVLRAKVSDTDPTVAVHSVLELINQHYHKIAIVNLSLVSNHFSHYYEIHEIRE